MKRETITMMLNGVDDNYISETAAFSPEHIQESPERIIHLKKKRIITFALAAALMLALGISAYAAWNIHQKRQSELREQMKIEDNAVTDYKEEKLSDAQIQTEGVTLLSTVNDGEFQKVYVNISPVEPEIARNFGRMEENEDGCMICYDFGFTTDGESFGFATPAILTDTDGTITMEELIDAAYDEETKTFTMECACINTMFSFDKPFDLTLVLLRETQNQNDHTTDGEIIRTFGTVTIYPTENTVRNITFINPYSFENAATGGKGKVIGVNLSSFNVDILVTHDNMENMYSPNFELNEEEKEDYLKEQLGWLQAMDELSQSMVLSFSDGSSRKGFGILSSPLENGILINHCGLGNHSIDINNVVKIQIGDKTVWEHQ